MKNISENRFSDILISYYSAIGFFKKATDYELYEMAKAIAGVTTHQHTLQLPLFDNTQHLPSLASALKETHQARQAEGGLPYGFLVRGHGLYVWGDSLEDAKRHLEAYEFLLACELEQLKIRSLG